MSIPATIEPTLGKLIPRLSSNHDGEVVATARAIERLLKTNGCDWHDLAVSIAQTGPADWRRDLHDCEKQAARLSRRELQFVTSLASWRGEPSDKQLSWLRDIAARLRSAP